MPKKSTSVRLGIIGLGGMGSHYANQIREGAVSGCELVALSDMDASKASLAPDLPFFAKPSDLVASGEVNAVIIATPHYSHTSQGIQALKAGLHVLVEKPISVHKADCERLIAAHTNRSQVFCAMFCMRTLPPWQKLKALIQGGELGKIRRANWIITDWFRTSAYYASGGWRATWAGEGGGVLLNQCPHNLDLWQWLFGMPARVRGFCQLGRYHDIEVEDDVTAYFEYPDGATGVFITSTGEAPGTNRLEITAERGRLVLEEGDIHYLRNEVPMSEFNRTTPERFGMPPHWKVAIPLPAPSGKMHTEIIQDFTNVILRGGTLLAPAREGIHSVELGNAILYSSLTGKTVELPLDGRAYERKLQELIRNSKSSKPRKKSPTRKTGPEDFTRSFR